VRGNRWAVLAVLCGALFVVSLDNTIVNVALPSIQKDLGASTAELQWVVDAYAVLFAGLLLLAGGLGDRFGRRRVFVIGLLLFALGSGIATVASTGGQLGLCRALMGVGGAFVMPSTLSILVQAFPDPAERQRAVGIWAAVMGVGIALGPLVGGALLERFSWHSVFGVNPPIALLVLVAALLLVPESRNPASGRLDVVGAVLWALGLIGLVLTIIEVPDAGLAPTTLAYAAVAVVSLLAFVLWERRVDNPILPLGLFASRTFDVAVAIVALLYFALAGAMFFFPQFMQLLFGRSPLESARIDMWTQRMDFELSRPIVDAFVHASEFFRGRVEQMPAWAERSRAHALATMRWLDGELAGRAHVAGSDYSMADIVAQCALVLGKAAGVRIPAELPHLARWFAAVGARPTARA